MGLTWASYWQLARVNAAGPETKNYAVLDSNWQTAALLFKRFEQHRHNAATPMRYPGYNTINPATPATPLLTLSSTGGSIAAGITVGVRLSFVDQYGLETEAAPETFIQTPSVVTRPNAPIASTAISTPVPAALPGGTYVYGITKRLSTGESLLSDITTVDIPFSTSASSSFSVQLTFDPISLYTDGTDSLCLYRSTGFDTNFVLLTTLTATPGLQNGVTTYTDDGTVSSTSQQPPQTSEFGKQNLLNIDWTTLNIPSTAYRFRVYLTQQAGVWGYQNLFQDYLLVNPTTPFPTSLNYQGTETLALGYPFDYTQIPFGAPLLNLSAEAIGAPIYTQAADAQGFPTYNFVLPDQNHATPVLGNAYVDTNTGQLKVKLTGSGYSTVASGSIYDAAVLADSPVSFWPLKETSGTTAGDIADSNPGSYTAGAIQGVSGPTNDGETAVTFNGTTSWIIVPDAPNLRLATPMSMEAWINPRDRNNYYMMTSKLGDYRLYAAITTGQVAFDWNQGQGIVVATPIPVNAWTHIVATYDGATALLYYNGAQVASSSVAKLPSVTSTTLSMGSENGSFALKGSLAKVAVYNTVLAPTRVLAHFNAASQSGYIHPVLEQGGHAASHIQAAPQVGGPTQDLLNNLFSTPVGGPSQFYRKQATNIYKSTSTPTDLVTSQSDGAFRTIGDLTTATNFPNISPDFVGQWFEISWSSVLVLSAGTSAGNLVQTALFINGVEINETAADFQQSGVGTTSGSTSFTWATPLTRNNNTFDMRWKTTQPGSALSYGGNVAGVAPQRYLYVKELW